MDHDRLFKELIRTFFTEFLELFLPEVAAYVRQGSVEFLDKEVFTDVTAAERHEVDLLAKAHFRDRDAFFLIHVENQAEAQEAFTKRMFRYFARLHEKFDLPVYPIAVLSYDSPQRPEPDEYRVTFPDRAVLDFRFAVIQLNRLNWRDFARRPNPVAAALMAKMRIAAEDRVRVKLECLRLLVTLRLDRARMTMIASFVDSYLRLTAQEQVALRAEVNAMPETEQTPIRWLTSWHHEGIQQGSGDIICRVLRRRFGELPTGLTEKIATLPTPKLESLAEALLEFPDLAAAEAWIAQHARAEEG